MGYKISSLKSLPLVPGIELYVFILGRNIWDSGWRKELEKNFNILAKELGPTAAIVTGHDGTNLVYELTEVASKKGNLSSVLQLEQMDGTYILLLGAHPQELTNDDLILLIDEKHIENTFGNMESFLNDLCEFAKNRNVQFLEKFEKKNDLASGILDILDLKPNVFGLGININEAVAKLRNWLRKNG